MGNLSLTDKEKQILRFLVMNGAHYPTSYLSKKLRLSPQTIIYKTKQLEERGVILGYRYRINPYKLGLKYAAWCAMRAKIHPAMDKTVDKLLSHPNIFSVLNLAGQFDIVAKVFYSEPSELRELIEWLGTNFKNEISQISIIPVMRIEKLHQIPTSGSEVIDLDNSSSAILNYKLANPHASLTETARELGMHRNTVSKRWKWLWDKGILLKKSVILSQEAYKALGYGLFGFVLIDLEPGEQEKLLRELVVMEPIHELFSLASTYNFLAILRSSDTIDCYKNLCKIYNAGNVTRTQTLVVLTFKEKQTPFLPIH